MKKLSTETEVPIEYQFTIDYNKKHNIILFSQGKSRNDIKLAGTYLRKIYGSDSIIQPATESDYDDDYRSSVVNHVLVEKLQWYQIYINMSVMRWCRVKNVPVKDYILNYVFKNVDIMTHNHFSSKKNHLPVQIPQQMDYLITDVQNIERKLVLWCKQNKHPSADEYAVRIIETGQWAVSFETFEKQGKEFILTTDEFKNAMSL